MRKPSNGCIDRASARPHATLAAPRSMRDTLPPLRSNDVFGLRQKTNARQLRSLVELQDCRANENAANDDRSSNKERLPKCRFRPNAHHKPKSQTGCSQQCRDYSHSSHDEAPWVNVCIKSRTSELTRPRGSANPDSSGLHAKHAIAARVQRFVQCRPSMQALL